MIKTEGKKVYDISGKIEIIQETDTKERCKLVLQCKNENEEFTKHIIYNDDAGQIIGINLDKLLSPLCSHEIDMVCSYAEGILTGKRLEE